MKNQKIKQTKNVNESTKEIRNLIIITLIIIAVAAGLYFITDMSLSKKNGTDDETTEVSISYDEITVGTIFNRPYGEYFVFAYAASDENASQYSNLITNYKSKDNALKIYSVNLDLKFNSSVLSEEANKKPASASELKIKDVALIRIKDGKVVKYYETLAEFEKALS